MKSYAVNVQERSDKGGAQKIFIIANKSCSWSYTMKLLVFNPQQTMNDVG
jgi:hypothetical protein